MVNKFFVHDLFIQECCFGLVKSLARHKLWLISTQVEVGRIFFSPQTLSASMKPHNFMASHIDYHLSYLWTLFYNGCLITT